MTRASKLWLLLLLTTLLPSLGQAAPRKLLVVVLDRVTWGDLRAHESAAPTLWELAHSGSVGAMCVRAASGASGGGYFTLGAGSRALAGASAFDSADLQAQAYNVEEKVKEVPAAALYQARTGLSPDGDRVVHLGLGEAEWQNLNPNYPFALGLLGDALRHAGLHVACLGNADTATGPRRPIVAFAMDENGRVELGDVGPDLLVQDDSLPYRYRTDPDRLAQAFAAVAARADVVFADLGETSRVEEYLESMPPTRAEGALTRALADADASLTAVLRAAPSSQWALLLLAPALPSSYPGRENASLTPVIWRAPGERPGLLTSPSTRRPGIIANTDLAASMLAYFDVRAPAVSIGRPMRVLRASSPLATLLREAARLEPLEGARRVAFRAFPIVAAVVLWLSAVCFLLGEQLPKWARRLLRGLLLLSFAFPSAMLLIALWPDRLSPAVLLLGALGLSGALAFAAGVGTRWRAADAVLAGLVAVLLALDLLTGQHMLHWSALSYSVPAGARFYGIGNEFAGAALGGSLMATIALLGRLPRVTPRVRAGVSVALLLLTALVGLPRLGANLGMALGCGVGFAVFGIYLWRGRFRAVDALLIFVALLGAAAVVVAADSLLAGRGSASHVGLLVATVREEGPSAFFEVAARKLSMSWTLVRVSVWTGLALGAVALFFEAIVLRLPSLLVGLRRRRGLLAGLISLGAGAVASLLFNDSGILAAAFALLYGAGSFAYLALAREETPRRRMHMVSMEAKRPLRAD